MRSRRKTWTPNEDAVLRMEYADGDLDDIAARLGVTKTRVWRRALSLNLNRSRLPALPPADTRPLVDQALAARLPLEAVWGKLAAGGHAE